ncbi:MULTISPECIES: cupin domain-containing protein [Paraburkholderia]|uniref:Cupin domain-containing protein n=1 Tax=Paraburkholderia metrosideri TaxID=580937 RepID=A0ABW9E4N1_9BURK
MKLEDKLHNWNDLEREVVRRGVERVGFRGEKVICVMNWLTPGMDVNPHSHPFEQLVLIVQGRVRFHVGEDSVEAGPGSMLRIPRDTLHYAEPIGDEVALNLDVFAPLRDDYRHLVAYQADEFTTGPGGATS